MAVIAIVCVVIALFFAVKGKGRKEKEMPQGLQVFDEEGNITLDTTDSLTRILGRKKLDKENGLFVIPCRNPTKCWFYVVDSDEVGWNENIYMAKISIKANDNQISWQYGQMGETGKYDGVLVYGEY